VSQEAKQAADQTVDPRGEAESARTARGMSAVDELLIGLGAATPEDADAATPTEQPPVDVFATQWTEFDLRCRDCQITHYVPFCIFLNAEESPELVQRITSGHFNVKRCPVCHQIEYVEHPYSYYDPARQLIVQVRPEWEWHAGGGEEWYAARLEDFFDKWSEYDVKIEVVFGPQPLIDRFLQDAQPAPTPDQS
jgi:hypothetical protein